MEPSISIESVLDALREVVRTYAGPGESHALSVHRGIIDEVWVTMPAGCIRPAVQTLVQELGIWHLSTLTASDRRRPLPTAADRRSEADQRSASQKPSDHTWPDQGSAGIDVLYHFWLGRGLSLRCVLPHQNPHLASVSDLIPGAAFYEREVAEMLGITFDGHPDPGLLLLPDDWEGGAPLRQDYAPGQHT